MNDRKALYCVGDLAAAGLEDESLNRCGDIRYTKTASAIDDTPSMIPQLCSRSSPRIKSDQLLKRRTLNLGLTLGGGRDWADPKNKVMNWSAFSDSKRDRSRRPLHLVLASRFA
jgi:hypothetical protein